MNFTPRHPPLPAGTQAVIFDFDGIIADNALIRQEALRHALGLHGVLLDVGWYQHNLGLSIREMLAAMPEARNVPHDSVIAASRSHLLAAMDTLEAIPATLAFMAAVEAAGLPSAVASGASGILVRPALKALGLEDRFATVVVREDAPRGKPAPDLFLEAARRLQIAPAQCLAVDDAIDGIAAAHAAGMKALTLADGLLVPVAQGTAT
ncbi:HAD family hydrolase [Streptomyces sp. H34-S4]|uniref:HAD family hydrolase n=1 Tax=Streptomyces sp. H34-S4 TaxID=2996463 RepID=UPI00226F3E89|nr:HAD family phosphatase [Streptomyces sp. H34-S4]MCY0935969.1 HAD family phosphatase [Streptomyces sp. H34-S4]